jgi:hypothetical protein
MSDLSESILLRRKLLAERGYRPVPVDREGNPFGAVWRAEALQDPPRATLIPVDPNAPYTGLLLGADGVEAEALIAVGLDLDPEKRESFQGVAAGGLEPGLEDREAIFTAVIAALDKRIGRSPVRRQRGGELAVLYRSRKSKAWAWVDVQASGLFIVDGEGDDWPDRRPEDVAFADLPFLDNDAWMEACAAGVGALHEDEELLGELDIEDVPEAGEPPEQQQRGFGRREPPPGLPPPPTGEPPDGPPPPPPKITVKSGKRHIAADKGLQALYDARVPFYNRSGELVRIELAPAKDAAGETMMVPAIRPVPLPALGRALGQTAYWFRLNPQGIPYRVDPPNPVVEMVAGMADRWKFPPLAGIARTPTLRRDLSLLVEPGYDPATALFAAFDHGLRMPRIIAARPSRRQAEDALALLLDVVSGFPFVSDRDRAAAVAAMLTAMVRPAFDATPMFVISSPLPGTGKSYLADCIAAMATGDPR